MVLSQLVCLAVTLPAESWRGDFVIRIKGEGRVDKPVPCWGKWKIDREATGTIILDRTFAGGGLARTPDYNNKERYETWVANSKQPIKMRIKDEIELYGPLTAINEIRLDNWKYSCPVPASTETWQLGKVAASILQFDKKEGRFEFESPRYYAKGNTNFLRKFVKGPPKWIATKPWHEDKDDTEMQIITGLNEPSEWFRIKGEYKPGQTEVKLSGKYGFTVPLGAAIKPPKVEATLELVLRKM